MKNKLQHLLDSVCRIIRKQEKMDTKKLIERIQAGDSAAFQSLVEDYQRLVGHIVFRMVSIKEEREDICQDVFLKIYQNLSEFRSESKLSTWIARIAYNACLNHLEKRKLVPLEELSPTDQSVESILEKSKRPDEITGEKEMSILLEKEINRMPVTFRTILTLYHLDEMSYAQIADVMGLPEGTVKSYLFRARKLLKERLKAKYQPEDLCL
jgi:RNA polymerase sigma factor (sigma-70 family)